MAKIRVHSAGSVRRILEAHGFVEVRRRGSHIVMQKMVGSTTRTVPIPNHRALRVGTLLSIVRQSGVPREEFE
ncbi:MAG: type II toxin-antitoxin system HicA family toxin [Acidobacteriia bacterium]|nr:type II toxin-antitoxin system HicA family toxin [Terriglobia bacterium]MYG01125.1 type II toxin-antitoxin system HicA family toxin [Terriglobia bacterium]MYK10629.1 type II toxin-antitoxin system HicA family toxin [Terriglobia bacterium]